LFLLSIFIYFKFFNKKHENCIGNEFEILDKKSFVRNSEEQKIIDYIERFCVLRYNNLAKDLISEGKYFSFIFSGYKINSIALIKNGSLSSETKIFYRDNIIYQSCFWSICRTDKNYHLTNLLNGLNSDFKKIEKDIVDDIGYCLISNRQIKLQRILNSFIALQKLNSQK